MKKIHYTKYLYVLMPILLLNIQIRADAYDRITKPDGYVAIYNACKEPVWIWTDWTADRDITDVKKRKLHRLDKIEPGKQFDYGGKTKSRSKWPLLNGNKYEAVSFNPNPNSWNGLPAMRIVPKLGCEENGANCRIGESVLAIPNVLDDDFDHLYYSNIKTYQEDGDLYKKINGYSIVKAEPKDPDRKEELAAKLKKFLYADNYQPQPSIESSFEGTFGCMSIDDHSGKDELSPIPATQKDNQSTYCQTTASQLPLIGNYYDVSLVDGFTLPVYIKVFQDNDDSDVLGQENSASCTDIDAANHLPASPAIRSAVQDAVLSRGKRPSFESVCTMGGVQVSDNMFVNLSGQNFSTYSPIIVNQNMSGASSEFDKEIGCAAPKTRLLMGHKIAKDWLLASESQQNILENLCSDSTSECNVKSDEYDSRVIQFACPYAQGDIDNFKGGRSNFADGSESFSISVPALDILAEYTTPFDRDGGRISENVPFATLIKDNFSNPAFRAASKDQGANNLCHGERNAQTGEYPTDYPIEYTDWVNSLRASTTNVYTYTYDDAQGLRRCNSQKSSFVYVLCGDETFVDENIPALNSLRPVY